MILDSRSFSKVSSAEEEGVGAESTGISVNQEEEDADDDMVRLFFPFVSDKIIKG